MDMAKNKYMPVSAVYSKHNAIQVLHGITLDKLLFKATFEMT